MLLHVDSLDFGKKKVKILDEHPGVEGLRSERRSQKSESCVEANDGECPIV